MQSRLEQRYKKELKPLLRKKYSQRNVMEIPELRKIVINMGIAAVTKEKNAIQDHIKELSMITGQKPIITRSTKAIANFKLKVGQPIGLKVTMRGSRMYDFFDRFCNFAVPRIRDFRGFSSTGDGKGNLNVGLEDQQAFCEVNLDEVKRAQGMNITFVTSAKNDEDMKELLSLMGFPFK